MRVKFQAKIPHRSCIITAGKCHVWGVSKNQLIWSVCKWAAYSRPVSRRGRWVYVYMIAYLQRWTAGWSNITERENWCSAVRMRVKCTESVTKQRDVTELVPHWPVIRADRWPEPCDRGTKRISRYERCELISQVQRPQQLRCREKMKTLMFSLTSKQSTGLPARRRYSYSSTEKMKDRVTTEGGNYSNAGLSIKPPRNMISHCGESQNGIRLAWFKGD